MRFHLEDFSALKAWLTTEPCTIRRLEWDLNPVVKDARSIFAMKPKRRPAAPPRPASLDEIERAFQRGGTPQLAGTILSEYFHINAPPSTRAVSLPAAVEHVEAFGAPHEFLLVGYHDGGLISVSRVPLPFQDGAKDARWWGVETLWGS